MGRFVRFALRAATVAGLVVLLASCNDPGSREDAKAEEGSKTAAGSGSAVWAPARETDPVPHGDDAADDPAIWINRSRPSRSTIIGTDKDGGVAVYTLRGSQIQYLADGEINNIDVRAGFSLGGRNVALATGGNRSDNSIAIYWIDGRSGKLHDAAARRIHPGVETYGSCMYRSARTGATYYFVTSKTGEVEQWRLVGNAHGRVDAHKLRSFDVGGVTEGCVADDDLARLYVGEESRGIWKYGAEPEAGESRVLVDSTRPGGHLTPDVEGLTIAYGSRRTGYLIASSQGSSSFVVYRRAGRNSYVTEFTIGPGGAIDGVEGTDGIAVIAEDLGSPFETGLFVAQDDSNDEGNQNFKLTPWQVLP